MALALLRFRFDVAFQLRKYSRILPAEFSCDQWFRYFEQAAMKSKIVAEEPSIRVVNCGWVADIL
jgi:hypothetical protein